MSKDIKVGDWVRVKPGHVGQDNVEFQVTRVVRSVPSTWGSRYAEGDPEGNGIWFRFLEKIDKPVDIKVGDWVKVNEGLARAVGEVFQVTEVKLRGDSFYVNGDKAGGGVWRRFLDKIDAPKPALDFVAEARSTLLNPVVAYRKELIALLESSGPDALPIVQAKLSAVNEVIARLQA